MARLGTALLKGLGVLLLGLLVLGVIGTIVGIVVSILQLVITAAVLALVAVGIVGLYSLVRGGDGTPERRRDRTADWRTAGSHDSLRRPEDEDPNWRDRVPGLGGDGGSAEPQSATERLREQYVAGEISEAEFERKMEQLVETEQLEDRLSDRGLDRTTRERLRDR